MTRKTSTKAAQVLQVAAKLFEARGYQGTSMDDVAAGVGLNKGTIYHYFPSKSAILFGIYSHAQSLVMASIEKIPPDAPADEALDMLVRAQLRALVEYPSETVVYFQEMRWISEWFDKEQVRVIRELEQVFTEYVINLIQRGIDDGLFAPTDPKIAAFGFTGLLAWTYQWFNPRGRNTPDEVADVFVHLMLHGLCRGTGKVTRPRAARRPLRAPA